MVYDAFSAQPSQAGVEFLTAVCAKMAHLNETSCTFMIDYRASRQEECWDSRVCRNTEGGISCWTYFDVESVSPSSAITVCFPFHRKRYKDPELLVRKVQFILSLHWSQNTSVFWSLLSNSQTSSSSSTINFTSALKLTAGSLVNMRFTIFAFTLLGLTAGALAADSNNAVNDRKLLNMPILPRY